MNRNLVLIAIAGMLVCGCATTRAEHIPAKSAQEQIPLNIYKHDLTTAAEAGYQEGVRQGAEAARRMAGPYVWRPYKVEVVQVPARIVNGIFYPGHQEEVIVRPTDINRVYGSPDMQGGQQ